MPTCLELETLFGEIFFDKYNTLLIGGYDEPVYLPASLNMGGNVSDINQLCYREDFFASALHEVSHWCIAGEERRRQLDFGYWYFPEGRTEKQQLAFQQVEIYPQALEWIFTVASGGRFRISVDDFSNVNYSVQRSANLQEQYNRQEQGSVSFAKSVRQKVFELLGSGLPERGRIFVDGLHLSFGLSDPYDPVNYQEIPW